MDPKITESLKKKLDESEYRKLAAIDNPGLHKFVAEYVELCQPDRVFVCSDTDPEAQHMRVKALKNGEETELAIKGHTVHFDGYDDQARDVEHTLFLLPKGVDLGSNFKAIDKETGLVEIREILKGVMKGREMYVRFFCLGPVGSEFSILSCQLTDSAYVSHSLDILYRHGYEEFKRAGRSGRFFKVVHGTGELEGAVCKNLDKRRVYIDCEDNMVYSTNTQYGGNTLGLKKLSMRLAIHQASKEGWLCEHMFVMGIKGPKGRVTYFTGAFPSLCGKTSTAMLTGETIVGDDIAYLRNIKGKICAVNVEKGMFGIIMGINSKDDPIIWKTLHNPNEIIFSNVLVTPDKSVYWIGKDGAVPPKGINHSGEWTPGKKDTQGKSVDPSHKNARFTLDLGCLENVDSKLHSPAGLEVGGVIYGGRDSHTWVPIREAFDWAHGIVTIAASLESETTAATLGKEGVPKFNPMSNLEFVSVPLGRYIQSNLDFGSRVKNPPPIFGVNYFLMDAEGRFYNAKTDKAIWLKWAELRSHGEVGVITIPVGHIPKYQDLRRLFQEVQGKTYTEEQYIQQFTLRVEQFLAKINRIVDVYKTKVVDTPVVLFKVLEEEAKRLNQAKEKFGNVISPKQFA